MIKATGLVPELIKSPAASLFREGYCELNGTTDIPFMETVLSDDPRCWIEPDFGKDEDSLGRASAFGKRAAAAYFLHLQSGDVQRPLHNVLAAMFATSERSLARQSFCTYLARLLWLYGQSLSPAQVAADVEAVILEDEALHQADLANLNQRAN